MQPDSRPVTEPKLHDFCIVAAASAEDCRKDLVLEGKRNRSPIRSHEGPKNTKYEPKMRGHRVALVRFCPIRLLLQD